MGGIWKKSRERTRKREREKGEGGNGDRGRWRKRETSHTQLSHFFSHRTDSFPPEGKLTFLIKNSFSVKREKVALHIKRKA